MIIIILYIDIKSDINVNMNVKVLVIISVWLFEKLKTSRKYEQRKYFLRTTVIWAG